MKRLHLRAALPGYGMDVLLLCALLWGGLGCFATAFGLSCDLVRFGLGTAVLCLLLPLVYRLPAPWSPLLPLALLCPLALLAWRLWDALLPAWAAVQCAVVNAYAEVYPQINHIYAVMELSEQGWVDALTLGALFFALLWGLLLGWAVCSARSFWLSLLLSAPLLIPGLPIARMPHMLPFLALVWGWSVLLFLRLTPRKGKGRVRLAARAMPAAALLLALYAGLLPWRDYQFPTWARNARQELLSTATSLSLRLGLDELGGGQLVSAGSSAQVDLNRDAITYDGHTVLRVKSEWSGHLYLRGHSAAIYEDNQWEPLPEDTYYGMISKGVLLPWDSGLSALNLPAHTSDSTYYAITVENRSAPGGCVYFPYQILTSPSELRGAAYVEDSYLGREQFVNRHTVYFRPDALNLEEMEGLSGTAAGAEAFYADFVYEHYLQLPDGMAQALRSHTSTIERRLDYSTVRDASLVRVMQAETVAEYLAGIATYDASAPAVPDGRDYVLYFLNESQSGYCMHFASAGVLLLRAMGIPARYVSGYIADVTAGKEVNVPDRNAHSWVEIYLDGYGWYPVEMTPGYTPQSAAGDDPTEPTPTPTPTASAAPSAAPTASAAPSAAPTSTPKPGTVDPTGSDPTLPLVLLAALVLCVLFLLRPRLTARWRQRRLRTLPPDRAAVYAYRYSRRLARWGAPVPEVVLEQARRAAFGRTGPGEDEREVLLAALEGQREALRKSLPGWKRLLARYIPALF
ncbi:hypothetical protein B5G43_07545 [Flavonifractor sp. An92]|uniref:transglutaminase-like domain-containing protein n=1 Tax=Flavonifractor sp. An92 TaxID=1965666 RepID=UPI000B38E21B|nr:transglutaminase-like domain-containing protein [Flavonifractor sp. An92]OUN06857.1 hypothetical protein B5G43_07545 [Flavonifractor sp. An92]